MDKYKLIDDLEKSVKGGCIKCSNKLVKCNCGNKNESNKDKKNSKFYINFDYESSESSEDEDEYNLKNIYNIGGSSRYTYRKKKYNMKVTKEPRKQSEGNKKWMEHVKTTKQLYPELPYKEVLKKASESY